MEKPIKQARLDPKLSLRGPADLHGLPEARLPFRSASPDGGLSLPEPCAWGNDVEALLRAAASLSCDASFGPVLVAYAVVDLCDCRLFLHDLAAQQDTEGLEVVLCAPQAAAAAADLLAQSGLKGQILAAPLLSQEMQQLLLERASELALVGLCSGRLRLDPALLLRARSYAQLCPQLVQVLEEIPRYAFPTLTPFATKTVLQQVWPAYDHRSVAGLNLFIPAGFFTQLGGLPLELLDAAEGPDTILAVAGRLLACRGWRAGAYVAPLLVSKLWHYQHVPRQDVQVRLLDLCPELRAQDGVFSCPKLSVVISAGPGLATTIESVLAQNWADLEICIPPEHFTAEDLPPIRPGGLDQVCGTYVLQLKAGDCLYPGALRQMLEAMEANSEAALCGGDVAWCGPGGQAGKNRASQQPRTHLEILFGEAPPVFLWRRGLLARCPEGKCVDPCDPYDLALKLAETGTIISLCEPVVVRVQDRLVPSISPQPARAAALARLALERDWQVTAAGEITRRLHRPQLFVWPDFSRANPYQHLLYRQTTQQSEILVAPIETALAHLKHALTQGIKPKISFHLHWTSPLLQGVQSRGHARLKIRAFLQALTRFKACGGRIIWTVHNTLSHDGPFQDLERGLSDRIVALADVVHLHSAASLPEVRAEFELPAHKVRIAHHGHYLGVYSDVVSRDTARAILGLAAEEQVILFLGQVRPYKGVGQLIESFRQILKEQPQARLLIGGAIHDTFWDTVSPALTDQERARILASERFLDEAELQLFLRAADLAVFPYRKILTSGALLLALSFDLPVVIPAVGMTREVLEGGRAGGLYEMGSIDALHAAIAECVIDRSAVQELVRGKFWPDMAGTTH